jgi:hypothetical protein
VIAVVFPWRPQPARVRAFKFVWEWWERHYPDAVKATVDSEHQPFNLAACRNLAVRWAEERDCQVVVIPDADSVPAGTDAVNTAISEAPSGGLHLPFTAQRYLNEAETLGLFDRQPPPTDGHHGNGALYVVTPDEWWRCGGQDERFSGWGGEDDQIIAAAETLIGLKRHWGTVWSLWHADEFRDIGSERHRPNAELAHRYWAALGKRDEMLALIAER